MRISPVRSAKRETIRRSGRNFILKKSARIRSLPCRGVELLDKDKAVIVTEAGQQFTGMTGRTFGYISHGETPFTAEDKT